VFRILSRGDSYRTDSESFSVHIADYDMYRDSIDLSTLGFTRLGSGYGDTLALRIDVEANRTYLKSFEADANGHRFELVFDSADVSELWVAHGVTFSPARLDDGNYGDDLFAGNLAGALFGHGGDDRIHGGLGSDLMDGGLGRDRLFGSAGADTYRISAVHDSYRDDSQAYSDRIIGFDVFDDRIDVSALGFTSLGNGHDGTLALVLNDTGTTTYLKSFDANAEGERFELSLRGDLSQTMTDDAFVFAQPDSLLAEVELLGVASGYQETAQA
jgi:Ca2+-binding RTX toxin-like protein